MSQNPPKDVAPSDLWQKLSERPRPTTTIPFPVRAGAQSPGDLVLWVLTEAEMSSIRARSDVEAKRMLSGDIKPGDLGYAEIFRNEMFVQLVALAARNPAAPEFPAFPTAQGLRAKCTTDEIGSIAMAYGQFRAEQGPVVSELTEPQMEAWLKVLQEGASRVPLALLSGEALIDLIMFLVSKVGTSPTGSGSAGSPPDDSSTPPAPPLADAGGPPAPEAEQ